MSGVNGELPRTRVERRTLRTWLWVLPALALAYAGWLVWSRTVSVERIRVRFERIDGVRPDDTALLWRGVELGRVVGVRPAEERDGAWVVVELAEDAGWVASEGARFWIRRPTLELGELQGLTSLVSGAHVEMTPGDGAACREFTGLERPPLDGAAATLEVVLIAADRGSLGEGSPVLYRGIEIGRLLRPGLGDDARTTRVVAEIDAAYAPLVRVHSRFWSAGEPRVDVGLGGVSLAARSIQALLTGAVELATPDASEPAAAPGTAFRVYAEPDPSWSEWNPEIALPELAPTPAPAGEATE